MLLTSGTYVVDISCFWLILQVPYASLPAVDRYMLARFSSLMSEVQEAYEGYQFFRIFQVSVIISYGYVI